METVLKSISPHKPDLVLNNPVMTAAGCYGLGREYDGLVNAEALGAVVVGPVTAHARVGAKSPRAALIPGGVLIHTGLENPGLPATLRRYGRTWARSPVPVIVHLAATTPDETAMACHRLDAQGDVAAIEVGLAPHITALEAEILVRAAAEMVLDKLVLVRTPFESRAGLVEAIVEAGADGLVVAAPPRGTALVNGKWVTGRLYGSFVRTMTVRKIRQIARSVNLPLVGSGGVTSTAAAAAMLDAGTIAVQVGAALWRDPQSAARIARQLHQDADSH
jgi:dihydroorotate dehydrogenase (NAD+) catalytic subunit